MVPVKTKRSVWGGWLTTNGVGYSLFPSTWIYPTNITNIPSIKYKYPMNIPFTNWFFGTRLHIIPSQKSYSCRLSSCMLAANLEARWWDAGRKYLIFGRPVESSQLEGFGTVRPQSPKRTYGRTGKRRSHVMYTYTVTVTVNRWMDG